MEINRHTYTHAHVQKLRELARTQVSVPSIESKPERASLFPNDDRLRAGGPELLQEDTLIIGRCAFVSHGEIVNYFSRGRIENLS